MPYDNANRAAAARSTRSRVLAAAHESFLTHGYAGTTIKAVAAAAGVSQETVYKRFGNKATLLKDVYDVAMAGDEEPVPIAARPEAIAVREASTPDAAVEAYAALARWLTTRAGDLMRIALTARGGDPDLEAFTATVDAERLAGSTAAVRHWAERGWLRMDVDKARDVVWTVNSPAVWVLLTSRGWSADEYQEWMADSLRALVFTGPAG